MQLPYCLQSRERVTALICTLPIYCVAGVVLHALVTFVQRSWTWGNTVEVMGLVWSLVVLLVIWRACWTVAFERPGNRELPEKLHNYAPRVLIYCDVCIREEAAALCRVHTLYVCLSCAHRHDRLGCSYDPLPIVGLVCQ